MTASALVVGLGSRDRGDDGIGPAVAEAVATLALPGVHVVEQEDPTALLDLVAEHDVAVVVDAVRSGSPPGTVRAWDVGAAPAPADGWTATGRGGTHAFGLATAVELGRALHRLPPRMVVVGVDGADFDIGAPLSAAVAAAVPAAVAGVCSALREVGVDVPG